MTLAEFLTACLADLEQSVLRMDCTCPDHGRRDANCPDFILADIEAKRAMIDLAYRHAATVDGERGCTHGPEQIRAGDVPSKCYGPAEALEFLQPLVVLFADRPGFDASWRL